jgi:CheY-like chemotaxis protein
MQENRPDSTKPRAKATILVVDDSPTIRKLVSMTLESRGYGVVVACDGVDGLAKMHEGLPDLILSDISMPKLDGYQFCKVVKSNKETKHIPVIMLSGNDGLFDKVRGKMAGSANYITKPFEPNYLVKEIEKFVKIDRSYAPSPPAPSRQPATAAQKPGTAAGGSIVKPVDPVAAKQLSKKLSGIYIPQVAVSSGTTDSSPIMPEGASLHAGAVNQTTSGRPPSQAPGTRRRTTKHSDEPEIKIFYHNESDALQPPKHAGAPSPTEQPFDVNRPLQNRSVPEPLAPNAQHTASAGLGIKPSVTTSSQTPNNASSPTTLWQAQQSRSAPSEAEKNHAAPQTQPQAPPATKPFVAQGQASPPPLRTAAQQQTSSIKAACTGCGTVYSNIKPEHIGKYARCKKCGTRFLIS